MKYLSILLLLPFMHSGVIHSTRLLAQDDKISAQLTQEREKLKRQTNPVDRTKTQIKISEFLLTLVGDAISAGDYERMQSLLDEYTDVVQDAHQTMVKTGRDAHSKPGGFKDLEIALRRQLRQLDDLGGSLSFDERDPVSKARGDVANIRDALLKALLGGQNAPAARS
jgi:hypothetical protein